MRECLRRYGYEVDEVGSVEEARRRLTGRFYSLAFIDLHRTQSEEMAGLEIVDIVRKVSHDRRTVILSGCGYPELEGYAQKHRADMFLRKPVGLRELGAVAIHLLGKATLLI